MRGGRIAALLAAGTLLVAGCGGYGDDGDRGDQPAGSDNGAELDPTPERLDGSASHEFEPDDLERAENAPEAVRDYCSDAVSEAQELGCLSHVDEGDIP